MLQTCRLFTIFTDEIFPMHCPDFQHEGAPCKIFTCCQEVNKRPFACLLGPIKSVGKGHESLRQHVACEGGWGVYVYVFKCVYLCVCSFSTCVDVCAENHCVCACLRTVYIINLYQKSREHRVAPC